mmetsp:Transcript_11613/g.38206  ORF Transcript_11613/g.38206 Transcript_11613/m.38206 type:complete len:390 (+) Transcript_11613:112-1281(+)
MVELHAADGPAVCADRGAALVPADVFHRGDYLAHGSAVGARDVEQVRQDCARLRDAHGDPCARLLLQSLPEEVREVLGREAREDGGGVAWWGVQLELRSVGGAQRQEGAVQGLAELPLVGVRHGVVDLHACKEELAQQLDVGRLEELEVRLLRDERVLALERGGHLVGARGVADEGLHRLVLGEQHHGLHGRAVRVGERLRARVDRRRGREFAIDEDARVGPRPVLLEPLHELGNVRDALHLLVVVVAGGVHGVHVDLREVRLNVHQLVQPERLRVRVVAHRHDEVLGQLLGRRLHREQLLVHVLQARQVGRLVRREALRHLGLLGLLGLLELLGLLGLLELRRHLSLLLRQPAPETPCVLLAVLAVLLPLLSPARALHSTLSSICDRR